jgi:hypothetical protein
MTQLVVYALVGKLIIFLLQKFPKHTLPIIGKLFREGRLLGDLFSCNLCLGFWVYSGLAFLFQINLTNEFFYIPILSEFVSGAIVAFLMHLISAGWEAQYQNIIIE